MQRFAVQPTRREASCGPWTRRHLFAALQNRYQLSMNCHFDGRALGFMRATFLCILCVVCIAVVVLGLSKLAIDLDQAGCNYAGDYISSAAMMSWFN